METEQLDRKRQIYLLNPKELTPETIAVAFAKTSRSPLSFRDIAAELTDEKSAQFNEKWVVGYGHSSVAEHAVLHVAVENVSRLAIECIESNRLVSYTEKSTRYQTWNADNFYLPAELEQSPLKSLYIETCRFLLNTYLDSLKALQEITEQRCPQLEGESQSAYDRRLRARYVDVSRFLLPASCLANVGITANARALEHALQKMLSHPLEEVRSIGLEIKKVAQAELPSLVKYAESIPYLVDTASDLTVEAGRLPEKESISPDWCRLLAWDADGEARVLAAALYRFGNQPFEAILAQVENMDSRQRTDLAYRLLGKMDEHDIPLRELEHTSYTFDVLMDQGAYFEVKRHRMMTQTAQRLEPDQGFAIPRLVVEAGFKEPYCRAMEAAQAAYREIAKENPFAASYIIPNAYNRRVLLTFNLREAYHFCQLRSASNAHFSARRVARRIAELIRSVHPALAAFLRLPEDENWQSIQENYFAQIS